MSDLPTVQRQALEAWASQAIDAGWLPASATDSLQSLTTAAPAQLFETQNRPLVAGFFGGTGVGKSTLLNRLAGETIARASVERPTSRDITVYVHRSVSVDRLPAGFPMQHMRTALHNNEKYRNVMFIDMPDFDSVESANRDLVNLWLPHLDVVLYVVSPERYRDDQGWRLLLRHATEHAWLFVMNHWDRGDPVQLADFLQQLAAAGLEDPLLFRCDSSAPGTASDTGPRDDDFEQLQLILSKLSDRAIIDALDELGILARLRALKAGTDHWLAALGDASTVSELPAAWQCHWARAGDALDNSMVHKAQLLGRFHAATEVSWIRRWRTRNNTFTAAPPSALVDEAWLSRLDDILADFLNQQAQSCRLPLEALKRSVAVPYAQARRDVASVLDDAVQRALALPGNRWQRGAYRVTGILCTLLPLASMGWISWRVVGGFVAGGSNPAAYLGSNFAINGALLLILSWTIPAFLRHRFRPSVEKSVVLGVRQGLSAALGRIERAVTQGLEQLDHSAIQLRQTYATLWQSLAPAPAAQLPESVRRMLAVEMAAPAQRALAVRATTHSSTESAPVS